MKIQFLVGVLCVVVVKGQHYVPVIKDGVPIDTPEVQAAKAAHFEAYEKARLLAAKSSSNGQYQQVIPQYQQYQQQVTYQRQQYQQYQPQSYQQHQQFQTQSYQQYQPQSYQQQQQYQPQSYQHQQQNYAVGAYSSASPVDTPEVQQARAAHLAAFSQAQSHHFRVRRGIIHDYQPQPPQETPEVQLARYQHLVAHAIAHEEDDDDYYPAPHDDLYHIPILTKKGVPVNTASVKAARQQHRLAHQLAKSGVQISGGHSIHEPVIAPNGVPFDTPDVYIAKAQHLKALADESIKQNHLVAVSGYAGGHGY